MMRTAIPFLALAGCAPLELGEDLSASTVVNTSQFSYDATGLPTVIVVDATAKTVSPPPRDALGRATSVNGTTLTYGPDGALARATSGTSTIDYITDDAGHRLAKRVNGQFVEAYVDEGLIAGGLYMPIRFAGATVGVVHDGAFESVATDERGTVVADGAGEMRAAAFGERARSSALGRAIDFAQSGRDPDLAIVRMGVRDYDPATHQFLTPDPLFLSQPEKCLESPVECNLYGYARNRPADLIDPTGTSALSPGKLTLDTSFMTSNLAVSQPSRSAPWDPGPVPQGYLAQQEYGKRLIEHAEAMKTVNLPHASFERDAPSFKTSPAERFTADADMLRKAGPFGITVMAISIPFQLYAHDQYLDQRWMHAVSIATSLGDNFVGNFGVGTYGTLSTTKPLYLPHVPAQMRIAVDSKVLNMNLTKHNTY